MRIVIVIAWLFVGLGGLIFHLGPGREQAKLDQVDQILGRAQRAIDLQEWDQAVAEFDSALVAIPADKTLQTREVILAKAKAQMMCGKLPDARQAIEQLLVETRDDPNSDPRFVADVESTLANAQFYMTWLMRLEGLKKEEWLPEIESARQHYVQVCQIGRRLDDPTLIRRSLEDLEAAIRLARMDLEELQGLPLPSQ
jgi:hypothetical protein